MSDFLDSLGDMLSDQFSLGENSNRTLDLGDFSKQIDRSEERRYSEAGYLRRDPFNTESKKVEVLLQEPNATILIKKRCCHQLEKISDQILWIKKRSFIIELCRYYFKINVLK